MGFTRRRRLGPVAADTSPAPSAGRELRAMRSAGGGSAWRRIVDLAAGGDAGPPGARGVGSSAIDYSPVMNRRDWAPSRGADVAAVVGDGMALRTPAAIRCGSPLRWMYFSDPAAGLAYRRGWVRPRERVGQRCGRAPAAGGWRTRSRRDRTRRRPRACLRTVGSRGVSRGDGGGRLHRRGGLGIRDVDGDAVDGVVRRLSLPRPSPGGRAPRAARRPLGRCARGAAHPVAGEVAPTRIPSPSWLTSRRRDLPLCCGASVLALSLPFRLHRRGCALSLDFVGLQTTSALNGVAALS